ncbi:MAG TPA: class I SAM-dependent methyltransferase, partial [Candidatus Limnocylindrales bacterium]|nr:class I SAM-dependent methyltransferase [Candidatus Limnocylindrales bacterium]
MSDVPHVCTFCGGEPAATWRAKELRYGTGAPFTYSECATCGALELLDPPADLSAYYPADYPSFNDPGERLRHPIRRLRNQLLLGRRGPIAQLVERVRPHPAATWLSRTGTTRDSRILDVGSGSGTLLTDLGRVGFRHLTGVDRFIPSEVDGPGFTVIKGTIADVAGQFELVMFHHSLEHIVEQRQTVAEVARLLAPGGWCLVRLPIVPNVAWSTYGVDWVQLDPPRHVVIHSIDSLSRLFGEVGLTLRATDYDSTGMQFAGSEAYRLGLELAEVESAFTAAELRAFDERAT